MRKILVLACTLLACGCLHTDTRSDNASGEKSSGGVSTATGPSGGGSAVAPAPNHGRKMGAELSTYTDETGIHWNNSTKKLEIVAGGVGSTQIATAIKDPAAGTAGLRTLGTGATQAAAGNDSRLSDSRTPTAHATSHKSGGSDEVATTTPASGAIPKANGSGQIPMGFLATGTPDGTKYVRDDGTLATPAGAGDTTLAGTQTFTGVKTFGSTGAVGRLKIAGTTSGSTILDATATAGSGTVTLPTTGTLATLAGTETLTNKTLTLPVIGDHTNAGHNHQNTAGGGTLDAAAVTTGVFAIGRLATGTPDGTKFVRDDGTLVTPTGAGDMVLASTQTVTGVKTFGTAGGAVGKLKIAGSTSGSTILDATPAAGSGTVTLPTTGTLATLAGTETLSNKTFVAPALGTATSTGLTMSGAIAMGTNKVTGAGDPTAAQDLATKHYVDTPTVTTFTYTGSSGASSIDVSAGGDFTQTDTIGGNWTVTLTNGVNGSQGTFNFVQDGTGHTVTIAASGRTLTYASNIGLPTAASQRFSVSYLYTAENGTNYLKLGVTTFDVSAGGSGDMVLASAQTVTGAKTFGSAGAVGKLIIAGTTSGSTILDATATAGSGTVTLPTTGTLATLAGTETFTNKTLTTPTIGSFTNATHSHTNAAGGGALDAAAITTGVLGIGRLATGTPDGTKFVRDDGTLATPAGSGDMVLASVQTVTGKKTFGTAGGAVSKLAIAGATSGSTILDATAVAGSGTVTLPTTGTLSTLAGTETLTNKSIDGAEINSGTVVAARLPAATTAAVGAVQLNDTATSTSTTQAPTANAVKTVMDSAHMNNVITPTALTANTNDWNPTSWDTADVVRMSINADGTYNLTGLVPSTTPKVLINVSAVNRYINITYDDPASSAANRIYTPGTAAFLMAPITTSGGEVARLWYDTVFSRWVVIAVSVDYYTLNALFNSSLQKSGGAMTGALQFKTVAGITASTTQTQGNGALTGDINQISTVGTTNDTATLPSVAAGKTCFVANDGANTLKLYPGSGQTLGAGTNTSITMAAGERAMFKGIDTTTWVRQNPLGTSTIPGILTTLDSTSSTSTTVAAVPNSVKTAYDLANAALPKAGGTMTGAQHSTATAVTLSANAATLDVSAHDFWQLGTAVAAGFTLTLTNGADGDAGTILYKQDGTGGRKVTIAASGRTLVTAPASIAKINSTTVTAASASVVLTYYYYSAGGTSYVLLSASDTVAADFTELRQQLRRIAGRHQLRIERRSNVIEIGLVRRERLKVAA